MAITKFNTLDHSNIEVYDEYRTNLGLFKQLPQGGWMFRPVQRTYTGTELSTILAKLTELNGSQS